MPGQFQLSVDELVKEAGRTAKLGVPAVILFGIPDKKDEKASGAYASNGIVPKAVRALKKELPEPHRHLRRLPLRIHEPRPLRHRPQVRALVARASRPRINLLRPTTSSITTRR